MAEVYVRMLVKHLSLNAGEVVSLPEHDARHWCGELNPHFRVAERLPQDEIAAKMQRGPVVDKMEGPQVIKQPDSMPGITYTHPATKDEERAEEDGTPAGQRPLRREPASRDPRQHAVNVEEEGKGEDAGPGQGPHRGPRR